MRFDIITIFPEIFDTVFSAGIIRKALERGLIEIHVHNLRDFAQDKHKQVDDRPFGGGEGMVLKPEPIFAAVEHIQREEKTPVFLLSPQGKRFDFRLAEELAGLSQVILICGRYEGVDERVIEHLITEEISIGDFVLTGGESAAAVIVEAVSRFVPGVVGKMDSVKCDSFMEGLLDFPQYTRPREFKGMRVPDVLFSGDHKKIARWRRRKSIEKTWLRRPDMLKKRKLSPEDRRILGEIQSERKEK
ncbi:MAG: tRNA (guanosine(37)-N1)-methyltransferase TrmD [Candidatus Aminicenantales bacterium]